MLNLAGELRTQSLGCKSHISRNSEHESGFPRNTFLLARELEKLLRTRIRRPPCTFCCPRMIGSMQLTVTDLDTTRSCVLKSFLRHEDDVLAPAGTLRSAHQYFGVYMRPPDM